MASLQERHKWHQTSKELKQDLVLVTTESVHRNQWPLGVVSEVFRSRNGSVREMSARTSRGILTYDVTMVSIV